MKVDPQYLSLDKERPGAVIYRDCPCPGKACYWIVPGEPVARPCKHWDGVRIACKADAE